MPKIAGFLVKPRGHHPAWLGLSAGRPDALWHSAHDPHKASCRDGFNVQSDCSAHCECIEPFDRLQNDLIDDGDNSRVEELAMLLPIKHKQIFSLLSSCRSSSCLILTRGL